MDTWGLIIGNLSSILAMGTDSVSASRKTVRGMLIWQSVGQLIYGIGAIALKGYSAAVQNAISIVRNLAALGGRAGRTLQWIFAAAGVGLGLVFNNLGLVGLLPIVANLEYSLAVFRFKDNERALKFAFLISVALFAVFNACLWNIAGTVTNSALFVMTAVFLIKGRRKKK